MRNRGLPFRVVAVTALLLAAAGCEPGPPESTVGPPSPSPTATPPGSIEPSMSPISSPDGAGPSESPDVAESGPPTSASPSVPPSPGTAVPLDVLLAMLDVAPEDRTGYDRGLFVHWIDADHNGCDTRREVLIEEAVVAPTVGPGCSLGGGSWFSLYDDKTIGDTSKLQIDHVVALAEAWDSGASAWTPGRRKAYANDLDAWFALIAVSGSTNQSKSDKDPAEWLPPSTEAACPFLGAWIAAKVRWALTLDQAEHDAIATDIAGCASTTMPYQPVDAP